MNIKILTPEHVVFDGEVESVLLPGKSGQFQIFKDHVAIVSALVNGDVKIFTNSVDAAYEKFLTKDNSATSAFIYPIKNGVIEFNNNKGIILCD